MAMTAENRDDDAVPQYEARPSVPSRALPTETQETEFTAMEVDNARIANDRASRDTSVLSMDDIEAAQALEGLRTDYLQKSSMSYPNILSPTADPTNPVPPPSQQPEPLLALLTSHHPLLSTAINGSISAYASSKSYSAKFKSGAEFVERLGSPVVNTVGTAGRLSGVESGVRWMLRKRESNEQTQSNKRRRTDHRDNPEADIERGLREPSPQYHVQHQLSEMSIAEPLPPYDGQRSPEYEAKGSSDSPTHPPQAPQSQHWGTKFMMTTSALTAALNEESLRSLKYCLTWLLWANNNLGQTADKLKSVIEEWSTSRQDPARKDSRVEGQDEKFLAEVEGESGARDQAAISRHIQSLRDDVLQTLKKVANVVSTYAGGALPSNARELVGLHLKSLPQRFQLASAETNQSARNTNGEKQGSPPETVRSAQKVLSLATAGLDMTKQVSEILNGTIVSAEEWCNRFGKKTSNQQEETRETPKAWHVGDAEQKGLVSKQGDHTQNGGGQVKGGLLETDKPVVIHVAPANPDEKHQIPMDNSG